MANQDRVIRPEKRAIVGELPSGITQGLARQILTGMQYYTLGPGYLWAAIVVASLAVMAAAWSRANARPAWSPWPGTMIPLTSPASASAVAGQSSG